MKFLLSLLIVGVVSAKSRRSQAEPEEAPKEDLSKEVWGVDGAPEETGVFVPYDKTLPSKEGVRYYTASGYQECQLCLNLLGTLYIYIFCSTSSPKIDYNILFTHTHSLTHSLSLSHTHTHIRTYIKYTEAGEEYGVSYPKLCEDIPVKDMKPMCEAQRRTLQSCPEFNNQWCYQDLGGTQALRAPCPGHLVCHYCLGLNPLHCVEIDVDFEESV